MRKRRDILLGLSICTMINILQPAEYAFATSASQQKQEAEESLKDVNGQMEDLQNQQQNTKDKIEQTKKQLDKLFKEQSKLEEEMKENSSRLEQSQKELEIAQKEAAKQYENMKLRIQYMYENGRGDSLLSAIFEADGLADMLKRLEYVRTVHTSDRKLTEEFQNTVARIEEQKENLQLKQDELLFQQEAYLGRQAEIEGVLAGLTVEQHMYSTQLANAKEQASKYKEIIRKQDEIIKQEQLQAEANKNPGNTSSGNGQGQITGMDIVNFARRFVGNPYVWGGNSLTKGCDCSGFIHLVYKNFGYSVPRYSMSFLNAGTAVAYEDMRPGDIIVYERNKEGIGHVAIYMGNGKIVEAQSSATGITDNRSVDCRKIIGIRRIIQ